MNCQLVDENERKIISLLRENGKISLSAISAETKMPISTLHDKITKLNKLNIITRYAAMIDFKKIGYNHRVHLALRVSRTQKKEMSLFLQQHNAVNSLYEITGNYDFMVETMHRGINEYTNFIQGLKDNFEILNMQEFPVMEDIEREKLR